MGEGAWEALNDFRFAYTTTFTHFHLLGGKGGAGAAAAMDETGGAGAGQAARLSQTPFGPALFAPSLVYAARNRSGRFLSPLAAGLAARWQAGAPLVRLSLHPPDVRHPRLLAHARRLVEQMVATRHAVTKAGCADVYQPRPQNPPRQPGPQPPYGP